MQPTVNSWVLAFCYYTLGLFVREKSFYCPILSNKTKPDCSLETLKLYSHSFSSFRSSQESALRQRNIAVPQAPPDCGEQLDGRMGIQDLKSIAPTNSQQQNETEENKEPKSAEAAEYPQESSPVPGAWSPLLTNLCLCTALALSAYVCYRAYFHWCLFFLLLFVSPCLSTDVAKWTTLANQPALTLPVSGLFELQQIQVHSFNLTNAVRGVGWLPLLYYQPKHSLNLSSWMLRASVFQVSHPKYTCRL